MNRLFSDKELRLLIVPLIIEQILAITVGMADTMMISYAGEAAISGVALVDLINLLLMNVFAALATGGAVVSSQYLGKGNKDMCRESAGQLLIVTTLISLIIMAAVLLIKRHFLGLLYPSVAREVMDNAVTYLRISAYSYPFLAVFNSCAALFRSMGNSKISMKVSVLMNLINVAGNAVLIFGFSMGVAGAAWATAFSRGVAALIMVWLLMDRLNVIYINLRSLCRLNGSV
ncbi:MAG: MATE family efflux transporter, partial [[Clostridium] symbiosum]